MNKKATYPIDYAIQRLRQAVDLAEQEGDFRKIRLAIKDLEDTIDADNSIGYEDRIQDDIEYNAEQAHRDELEQWQWEWRDTMRSIQSEINQF